MYSLCSRCVCIERPSVSSALYRSVSETWTATTVRPSTFSLRRRMPASRRQRTQPADDPWRRAAGPRPSKGSWQARIRKDPASLSWARHLQSGGTRRARTWPPAPPPPARRRRQYAGGSARCSVQAPAVDCREHTGRHLIRQHLPDRNLGAAALATAALCRAVTGLEFGLGCIAVESPRRSSSCRWPGYAANLCKAIDYK